MISVLQPFISQPSLDDQSIVFERIGAEFQFAFVDMGFIYEFF
jgi:hypothetical protein